MVSLRRRVVGVCVLGLFALLPAALAAAPHFVSLNHPDATGTGALGINPAGDIVGAYFDRAGVEHGFVLRNGIFTDFSYPGATWTEMYGINPQGDIVGQYGVANGTTHGFLLTKGSTDPVPIDVGPSDVGPANTMPFKISAEGVIVGCLHQSAPNGTALLSTMHGFSINGADVTTDPLAGSMHTGINPSGAITGHDYVYLTPTSLVSYVIEGGVTTTFSYPGAAITRAYDINANGDVVGFYRVDLKSPFHGFLYRHGEMTSIDVDFAGAKNTRAFGISPTGDIVGYYQDAAGSLHGFLLTRRGNE